MLRKNFLPLLFASISLLSSNESFAKLVVFGDSLSDMDNRNNRTEGVINPHPYYDGRASNGKVWVEEFHECMNFEEQLLSSVHEGGTNFAVCGAPSGQFSRLIHAYGLIEQVHQYRENFKKFEPEDLVVIWIGGNDLRTTIGDTRWQKELVIRDESVSFEGRQLRIEDYELQDDSMTLKIDTLKNIQRAFDLCREMGARNFLIGNIPPFASFPLAEKVIQQKAWYIQVIAYFFESYVRSSENEKLWYDYNEPLEAWVSTFDNDAQVDVRIFDAYSSILELCQDPHAFGLESSKDKNCDMDTGKCENLDKKFVHWDDFHLSEISNKKIGIDACRIYKPEQESFTYEPEGKGKEEL